MTKEKKSISTSFVTQYKDFLIPGSDWADYCTCSDYLDACKYRTELLQRHKEVRIIIRTITEQDVATM